MKILRCVFLMFLISIEFISIETFAAKPGAIIFDLDDTLFDTRYRHIQIYNEIGILLGIDALLARPVAQIEYSCNESLKNAGILDPGSLLTICGDPRDFKSRQTSLWGSRFFSSKYLTYDQFVPGADVFLDKLRNEFPGVTMVFLTARPQQLMQAGTLRSLEYYGLLSAPSLVILLGDEHRGDAVSFKKQKTIEILKNSNVVAVFEDDKKNANMFRSLLSPNVPIVKPTRDISQTVGVDPGITLITNYFYDVDLTKQPNISDNQNKLNQIVEAIRTNLKQSDE